MRKERSASIGSTGMTVAIAVIVARDDDIATKVTMIDGSEDETGMITNGISMRSGATAMTAWRTNRTAGDDEIVTIMADVIESVTIAMLRDVRNDVHGTIQETSMTSAVLEKTAVMNEVLISPTRKATTEHEHGQDHHTDHASKTGRQNTTTHQRLQQLSRVVTVMQQLKNVLPSWQPCQPTPMISRTHVTVD
jgi:hypothetical protein